MSSIADKISFTEKMADRLVSKERFQADEESYAKAKYGMEVILINTMKISLVYLIAIIAGIFLQTLIVHLAFLVLRRYSFGLHALKSFNCTLTSLLMFTIGPFIFQEISSSNLIVMVVFAFVVLNMLLYAPADTENLLVRVRESKNT
ncbi:regulator [Listeria floridensis FSL S10-1187]|uniref:Regulator n=1 Tax=Listeria floridensis FSL S10-1187 TaxID=1265817 RepID=A0ABP3AXA9_9LIST|nr:accessory gene regulator B family protein [Listeria floridensis]EUJ30999.1 regulator [Listeria floridensis FSL S10-1187]